jgi:arsenate reductase (glutaredoxin)
MLTIYHNPRCSKSRETLQIIQNSGKEFKIVEYLENIPKKDELKKILQQLNLKPQDILRKNEAIFKEKFKGFNFNDDEWINIMIENPKLIERPIVIDNKKNKGIIGRPPENVIELLK